MIGNEQVLYDRIVIPQEWESEVTERKIEPDKTMLISVAGTLARIFSNFNIFSSSDTLTLPSTLVKFISSCNPWQVSRSPCGDFLLVIQKTHLELRSSADDFESCRRCQIPKDKNPEWRKVFWAGRAWNKGQGAFALTHSSGKIFLFSHDLVIEGRLDKPTMNTTTVLTDSLAGVFFPEVYPAKVFAVYRNSEYVVFEMDKKGRSNIVIEGSLDLTFGVEHAVWSDEHQLLITVGGSEQNQDKFSGTVAWRIIDDETDGISFARAAPNLDGSKFLSKVGGTLRSFLGAADIPCSYNCSISPDHTKVIVTSLAGEILLFSLPNLSLIGSWKVDEFPFAKEFHPDRACSFLLENEVPNSLQTIPTSITWWDDEHVILSRICGTISIHSLNDDLGLVSEVEWASPFASLSDAKGGSVLGLECSISVENNSKKEPSLGSSLLNLTKNFLFYLTDLEAFQDDTSCYDIVTREYSLFRVDRTTPQQMYLRLIDVNDFQTALAVADQFDLDPDLVFKKRWESSDHGSKAIDDFLCRIKCRKYTLSQIYAKVPPNPASIISLLQYGLRGTDIDVLEKLGTDNLADCLTWIPETNIDYTEDDSVEDIDHRRKILSKFNFSDLKTEQISLIRERTTILRYLARLKTFEDLNPRSPDGPFLSEQYRRFRDVDLVEYAALCARKGDVRSLEILFRHHNELDRHRLALLSSFPESLAIEKYLNLLPKIHPLTSIPIPIEHIETTSDDWCNWQSVKRYFKNPESGCFLYEIYFPELEPKENLSTEDIADWYCFRAEKIEARTGIIELSLQLLNIAAENSLPRCFLDNKLASYKLDFKDLAELVYVWEIHHDVSLASFKTLSARAKINIILNRLNDHETDKGLSLIQGLMKDENKKEPGSRMVIMKEIIEEDGLWFAELALEKGFLTIDDEVFELIIFLAYMDSRQISPKLAMILNFVPEGLTKAQEFQVSEIKDILECQKIISKWGGADYTLYDLSERSKSTTDSVVENLFNLLVNKTRNSRDPESIHQSVWIELFEDILSLRSKLFQRFSIKLTLQTFVRHLLTFAGKDNRYIAFVEPFLCQTKSFEKDLVIEDDYLLSEEYPKIFILSFDDSAETIIQAAHDYLVSASDVNDPYVLTSLRILNLIDVEEESVIFDRVSSNVAGLQILQFLSKKGTSLLPHVIISDARKNPRNLIKAISAESQWSANDATLFIALLINVSKEHKSLEDELFVLAARESLARQFWDYLEEFALEISKRGIGSYVAADFCFEVGKNRATLKHKNAILMHALNFCEEGRIEEILDIIDEDLGDDLFSSAADVFHSLIPSAALNTISNTVIGVKRLGSSGVSDDADDQKYQQAKKSRSSKITDVKERELFLEAIKDLSDPANFATALCCYSAEALEDIADSEETLQLKAYFASESELKSTESVSDVILSCPDNEEYKALAKFIQGDSLSFYGVDAEQFACDTEYRRDTILGLAETEDSDQYKFAMELASQHDVDTFELAMGFLENALLNGDVEEIELAKYKEMAKDARFGDRLEGFCWKNIKGSDHPRLKMYWTLRNLYKKEKTKDEELFGKLIAAGLTSFDFKRIFYDQKIKQAIKNADNLSPEMTVTLDRIFEEFNLSTDKAFARDICTSIVQNRRVNVDFTVLRDYLNDNEFLASCFLANITTKISAEDIQKELEWAEKYTTYSKDEKILKRIQRLTKLHDAPKWIDLNDIIEPYLDGKDISEIILSIFNWQPDYLDAVEHFECDVEKIIFDLIETSLHGAVELEELMNILSNKHEVFTTALCHKFSKRAPKVELFLSACSNIKSLFAMLSTSQSPEALLTSYLDNFEACSSTNEIVISKNIKLVEDIKAIVIEEGSENEFDDLITRCTFFTALNQFILSINLDDEGDIGKSISDKLEFVYEKIDGHKYDALDTYLSLKLKVTETETERITKCRKCLQSLKDLDDSRTVNAKKLIDGDGISNLSDRLLSSVFAIDDSVEILGIYSDDHFVKQWVLEKGSSLTQNDTQSLVEHLDSDTRSILASELVNRQAVDISSTESIKKHMFMLKICYHLCEDTESAHDFKKKGKNISFFLQEPLCKYHLQEKKKIYESISSEKNLFEVIENLRESEKWIDLVSQLSSLLTDYNLAKLIEPWIVASFTSKTDFFQRLLIFKEAGFSKSQASAWIASGFETSSPAIDVYIAACSTIPGLLDQISVLRKNKLIENFTNELISRDIKNEISFHNDIALAKSLADQSASDQPSKELQKLIFIMDFLSNLMQENEDTPVSELNDLKKRFLNGHPSLDNISKLSKICRAAQWIDYVKEAIAGDESIVLKDVIVYVLEDNIEDLKHIESLLDGLSLINSSFEEDKKMKEMIYFGLARAIERKTYSLETYLFVLNKYPIAMEMISDLTVFECVLTMMNNPPDLTSDSTADALENLQKFRKVLKRIGRPLDTVSKWINIFRLMASDPLQDLLYMNCSVVEEIFERFQADESVSDLFISQREIFEDQDYWDSVASLLIAIDGDYERSLNGEDQEMLPEVSMSLPKLEMTEIGNVDEEGWNEEDSDLDLPSDDDDIIAEAEQDKIASNLSDEKTDNSADSVENAALDVEVDQNVDQNEEDNDTAVNNCEENDLDLPADEDEKLDVEEQFASSDQNKIDANEQFKEDSTENQEKNLEEKTLDEEVDANEEHQNFSTECESKTVSDDDEEAGWNDGEESDLDLPDENENLPIGEINISEENSKESRDECSDVNLIPKIVQSDDEEVKSNVFDSHDSKVEDVDIEKSEVSSENNGWDNEESDLELPPDSVDDPQATFPEFSHQSNPDEISKEPHVSSDSIQTELEGLIETRALSEHQPDATIEKNDKPNEPIINSVPHVEGTLSDTSSNDGWDQEESDLELPSDDDQDAEKSTTDAKNDDSKIQEDQKDEKLSGWNNHNKSTFDLASDDAKIEDAVAEDKSGEIVPGKPETTENDAEENEGWQNDDESDLDLPSDLEEDKINLQSASPDGWGDESDLDLGSEEPSSPAQVESIVQSPEPEGWNEESDIDLESDKQSDNGGWEDEDLDLGDDDNPLEPLLNRYHVALRNPESEEDIKGLISALRNKGEFQKASVLILRLRNTHPAFLNLSALRAADIWEKDMDFS